MRPSQHFLGNWGMTEGPSCTMSISLYHESRLAQFGPLCSTTYYILYWKNPLVSS
jgi:hypothetical protein